MREINAEIIKHGLMARGKRELTNHLNGKKLTWKQACLAKCYECCAGYTDGKVDCGVKDCPIYGMMPFKNKFKSFERIL